MNAEDVTADVAATAEDATAVVAATADDEIRAKKLARDMLIQWDRQLRDMKDATDKVDWSGTDWSKLNPKDVGVRFGPAMTEEQFAEYRKNKNVNVLRGTGLHQKE